MKLTLPSVKRKKLLTKLNRSQSHWHQRWPKRVKFRLSPTIIQSGFQCRKKNLSEQLPRQRENRIDAPIDRHFDIPEEFKTFLLKDSGKDDSERILMFGDTTLKNFSLAPNQTYRCFYGVWRKIRKCRNLFTFKRWLELFVPSALLMKKSKNRCKSYKVAIVKNVLPPLRAVANFRWKQWTILLHWFVIFFDMIFENSGFAQFNSYNRNNFYSVTITWHPVASIPGTEGWRTTPHNCSLM